jgi:hypothetical protein
MFIRQCDCPYTVLIESRCGHEHCDFSDAQKQLSMMGLSIWESIFSYPDAILIRTTHSCPFCILEQAPEHFSSDTFIAYALEIARPIIQRANTAEFLNMDYNHEKRASVFRLEGQDLTWLYNTRESMQIAIRWLLLNEAEEDTSDGESNDEGTFEESRLKGIYNMYVEIVEYNLIADIERRPAPGETPEWLITLRGLSETPEI